MNFRDWPFVTSPKVLAISKFFQINLIFAESMHHHHLRDQDQSVVYQLINVCSYSYKFFVSQIKGKSASEIFLLWNKFLERYSLQSLKEKLTILLKKHSGQSYLVHLYYTYCCIHVNSQVGADHCSFHRAH